MRAIIGIAIIAIASSVLMMTAPAYATQVIPKSVEFTNDNNEQGGKPQVCVVSVAITNPPEPEVVNFQFMVFINGRRIPPWYSSVSCLHSRDEAQSRGCARRGFGSRGLLRVSR
jgi:hypothetical protein